MQRLARNSLLNFAGQVLPLGVAIVAVPRLIAGLGLERFGILTLAWTAIGYFSLFDLGLGRALTRSASAAIGGGRLEDLPVLTAAAMRGMTVLGIFGALVLAALTPVIVGRLLDIQASLRGEAVDAFYWLAASLPFVVVTAGLRSLFEAHQDFGVATALRLPFAIFNYVAPLAVLGFSHSLSPVMALLVLGRILMCASHWIAARRRYPFVGTRVSMQRHILLPMLRTGGWMTVSNVLSPLMVQFDRFVVAAMLSVQAVTYYATPFDVVMKPLVVPGALLGVLFPEFAARFEQNRSGAAALFDRAVRFIVLAMFPPVLVFVAFAREGMQLWLGPEFARLSGPIVQWLAAGLLINSVGYVPFGAVQGMGRADLTAKLHAIEFPLYTAALFVCARSLGLVGVAMAWTFRVALDTTLLWRMAARLLNPGSRQLRSSPAFMLVLLAVLIPAAVIPSVAVRVGFVLATLGAFAVFGWSQLLAGEDRRALRALIALQ